MECLPAHDELGMGGARVGLQSSLLRACLSIPLHATHRACQVYQPFVQAMSVICLILASHVQACLSRRMRTYLSASQASHQPE